MIKIKHSADKSPAKIYTNQRVENRLKNPLCTNERGPNTNSHFPCQLHFPSEHAYKTTITEIYHLLKPIFCTDPHFPLFFWIGLYPSYGNNLILCFRKSPITVSTSYIPHFKPLQWFVGWFLIVVYYFGSRKMIVWYLSVKTSYSSVSLCKVNP
jgi:hypothetical protein